MLTSPFLFISCLLIAALALWLKFAFCDISLYLTYLLRRRDTTYFSNKVVWITGASQGLGEALALYFAAKGSKLILSARNEDKLKAVAEKCGSLDRVHVLPFDLRQANWEEIAAAGMSSFPDGVDYVIHNAGMSQHSSAAQTKVTVTNDMFQLNTIGPIALTQALLPEMINKSKGRFVVISSMAGKIPSPGQAIYSSTKFAMMGYFQTLQSELASSPIGVTICCPGPFNLCNNATQREVYRKEGLVKEEKRKSIGLPVKKVVHLIALATQHRLSECWIAKQPILLTAYLAEYFPFVLSYLLRKIGPKRAAAVETGDGYSMKKIFSVNKTS